MKSQAVALLLVTTLLSALTVAADPVEDYLFASEDLLQNSLRDGPARAPSRYWLEDPEFRLVPDRNTDSVSTETYRLRFRPTTGKERRADTAVFRLEDARLTSKWRAALSSALAERYHHLIDLIETETQLLQLRQQLQLDRDLLAAEQALASSREFSATRLRSAAERVERQQQAQTRGSAKVAALREAMAIATLPTADAKLTGAARWVLQPAQIGELLQQVQASASDTAFDHVQAQLTAQHAEQALTAEKGKSGLGMSLLEVGYQDDRVESYTLTFGFRIPFAQRPHVSARLQRELLAARQDAELAERSLAETLRYRSLELRLLIAACAEDSSSLAALQARKASAATDAASFAALRGEELALSETISAKHMRLLREFVDLLDYSGQLNQAPQRNWLRSDA